jgi:uncharacterized protein with PQ loop repeat
MISMRLAFLLSVMVLLPMTLHASQISVSNYTAAQANATIASVYGYVNSVNESGYLIFEPNLTAPYNYLGRASELQNRSPDVAVVDAQTALSLAEQQYNTMSSYRQQSLPIIVAFTVAMLFVLVRVMAPIRAKNKKGVRDSPK